MTVQVLPVVDSDCDHDRPLRFVDTRLVMFSFGRCVFDVKELYLTIRNEQIGIC